MNSNVKLYNFNYFVGNVVGAGSDNPFFVITEQGRRFVLNSIKLLVKLVESVSGKPLPLEMNQVIEFGIGIYSYPDVSIPPSAQPKLVNGMGALLPSVDINLPGIYRFDNFPFIEQFELRAYFNNKSALSYDIRFCALIEIEFIDIQ